MAEPDNHVGDLNNIREELVRQRRGYAKASVNIETPSITSLLSVQSAIDMIDRAITDERRLAPTETLRPATADDPCGLGYDSK